VVSEDIVRLVMIGFDQTMLCERSGTSGDTRERHIRYARALRSHYPNGNIDVILAVPPSWSSQRVEIEEGLTVHPVPSRRSTFVMRAVVTLDQLFRQQSFDLVTTQTPFDDGLVGIWAKWKFGVSLNVQMRSSFLDMPHWISERPLVYRVFNLLGKWVANRADTIRVVSDRERQRLEQRFRRLHGKVAYLHPLVNTQIFDQCIGEEELENVRKTLNMQGIDESPFLLFVGRFALQKNLLTLFKAFALVNQQMPQAILVMAGEGPLRGRLERFAKRLKIEHRVVWLGNLPLQSLRAWYAAARATVLPSFHEGFPKIVGESYLMGTPVIATPFVSAHELICDGETGYVAPKFTNHRWLANRALELLSHPEQSKEMGRKGREYVQKYLLTESEYFERLMDIWSETAKRGCAATQQRENLENVQD
jgi:glycosyltransferase involved in cell wall biosynthesis